MSADRLDKWLWHARFFKTRSLATEMCLGGRIRIDGAVVTKAHAPVRPGQVLSFVQGRHVRVVKVLAIAARRGPAVEAQQLYEDLSPPSEATQLPAASREAGAGRPTKRDRRALERFVEED